MKGIGTDACDIGYGNRRDLSTACEGTLTDLTDGKIEGRKGDAGIEGKVAYNLQGRRKIDFLQCIAFVKRTDSDRSHFPAKADGFKLGTVLKTLVRNFGNAVSRKYHTLQVGIAEIRSFHRPARKGKPPEVFHIFRDHNFGKSDRLEEGAVADRQQAVRQIQRSQ